MIAILNLVLIMMIIVINWYCWYNISNISHGDYICELSRQMNFLD
jgi:hypothetical protein